jgi:hypothetical protein
VTRKADLKWKNYVAFGVTLWGGMADSRMAGVKPKLKIAATLEIFKQEIN